jgi:hypothetical protein
MSMSLQNTVEKIAAAKAGRKKLPKSVKALIATILGGGAAAGAFKGIKAVRERKKEAQREMSRTDKALKFAPGAGAVAGGAYGFANPASKAIGSSNLKSRFAGAIIGAGLGATTGWLPQAVKDSADVARDTYRGLKKKRAKNKGPAGPPNSRARQIP